MNRKTCPSRPFARKWLRLEWLAAVLVTALFSATFIGFGPAYLVVGVIGIALIVVTAIRFGLLAARFVGPPAILRFYVLHCVGFPLIAAFLIAVHFWRVRKDGGISGPL